MIPSSQNLASLNREGRDQRFLEDLEVLGKAELNLGLQVCVDILAQQSLQRSLSPPFPLL